jgi:hyaluronan synthase
MLVRLTDLWFVTGQLVDRSAQSALGGVLVNSGVLAAYRRPVIWDNLDSYLNETFFGRKIEFSDDSMLTIYALQRGHAVQQPTAFALTLMPDNFSQLFRMYVRWMRGAFIRTFWRFRYLPLNNYAYWGHLMGWMQMVLSTVIFLVLFVWVPVAEGFFMWELFMIPVLIGYGQSLRYLSFRRTDDPFWAHFGVFLLAPVAQLFSFFVFRLVRWYAMATCLKTGWGTRQGVELDLAGPGSSSPVALPVQRRDDDTVPLKVLLDPYATTTTELPLPKPLRGVDSR